MKKVLIGTTAFIMAMMSAPTQAQTTSALKWPSLSEYHVKTGDLIDPTNVRRMVTGLSKKQVRLLLNNPHTSEGLVGVREWDYLFSFLTGRGEERVSCPYKVLFDKDMNVSSTHWKNSVCEQYVKGQAVVNQTYPITLNMDDGFFAFGRSGLQDIQKPGRDRLNELAMQIKTGFSTIRRVTVVGHTDRIGSTADNLKLSQARAQTVKQFLIDRGVSASLITSIGKGATEPTVTCPGAATSPAVIACLAPNRRVEVLVNGDK